MNGVLEVPIGVLLWVIGAVVSVLGIAFSIFRGWTIIVYRLDELIRHAKETNGSIKDLKETNVTQLRTNYDIERRTKDLEDLPHIH